MSKQQKVRIFVTTTIAWVIICAIWMIAEVIVYGNVIGLNNLLRAISWVTLLRLSYLKTESRIMKTWLKNNRK